MPTTIEELMLSLQTSIEEEKKEPAWDKFYSVYMFDEIKYHKLCKEKPKEDRTLLKQQCYVLDYDGKKKHLGDSKHIYRYKTLDRVKTELADYCTHLKSRVDFWDKTSDRVITNSFTLFYERYTKGIYSYKGTDYKILEAWDSFEVELNDSWQLPIKTRLLLHISVLKKCRQGMSIEDACKNVLATYRKEDIMK